jgi:hypothetical protein
MKRMKRMNTDTPSRISVPGAEATDNLKVLSVFIRFIRFIRVQKV